jgi:lipid II:glycine glycyltransferase (peptidoglycan interpeptide bridge formation enzyme)
MTLHRLFKDTDVKVTVSRNDTDPHWDSFLDNAPEGQFEQTSMWARVKGLEGWEPLRILLWENQMIIGGFQILTRSKKPFGRVGYISKGPVLLPHKQELLPIILKLTKEIALTYRIDFLIVHPPRLYAEIANTFIENGFMPNYIKGVIQNATVVIDVGKDDEALLASVKRKKKQNIKRAYDSGIIVREGSFKDLSAFHSFMLETCKRIGVVPNPSRLQSLILMWQLFHPVGKMKLFFASFHGEDISGLIAIPFGHTVNLWKFGWSGKFSEYRPNDLLFWETFKWSRNAGYRKVDLVHIDADSAQEVVQRRNLPPAIKKSSSFFKLGWGGEVVILPEGYIFCRNLIMRALYPQGSNLINSWPWLKKKLLGAI